MQEFGLGVREVCFACQIEPQQTVPFEREAARTECVLARRDVSVGHELAVFGAAHGALAPLAAIEQACNRYGP